MTNNIKVTVEELRKLINVDSVIGKPIETEDKILIPVIKMGFGFGGGENFLGKEGSAAGGGAGVEPVSMVILPKKGSDGEGIRVLDLSERSEANKAMTDLGLIITDLVKKFMDSQNEADYDESEYIEPEFTTSEDVEE